MVPVIPVGLARSDRSSTRSLAFAGLRWTTIGVLLLGWCLVFRRTFIDDTYITLQYVRTLIDHGEWGFYPGQPANTATSPLNVIVLSAVAWLVGSPLTAVSVATAAQLTLSLRLLLDLSHRVTGSSVSGWLSFTLLLVNPLLLSALGLVSQLSVVLLLATATAMAARRWRLLGVALGLLAMTRPEGILLCGIVLLLMPAAGRVRLGTALTAALTAAPWYLFSWVRLGSLVPDTLLIKLEQQPWLGTTTFVNGPAMYLDRYTFETILSVWPVLLAPLAVLPLRSAPEPARRAVLALSLYAAVHYAGYSILGVPPFHWYYVPEVAVASVLAGLGIGYVLGRLSPGAIRLRRLVPAVVAAVPVLLLLALLLAEGSVPRQALIHSNWGTPDQYRGIALGIRNHVAPTETVELRGEIGTLAYYSDRQLTDIFTDPGRTDDAIARVRADQPRVVALLMDLNFLWRDSPARLPDPTWAVDFAAPAETPAGPDAPIRVMSWVSTSSWVQGNRIVLSRLPVPAAVSAHDAVDVDAAGRHEPRPGVAVELIPLAAGPRPTARCWGSRAASRCPRTPRRRRSAPGLPRGRTP